MQFDHAKRKTTTAAPTFPAQLHDAKAAVRWLRANADRYHVDPDRIGVVGFSAGGHLALLLGLTDPSAELEGDGGPTDPSSRVQAVVNFFGPTEMTECYRKSNLSWLFRLFLDGTPEEVPDRYRAASPLTYASRDDPPVLTIHGDKDLIVPVNQARVLDKKMNEVGASHTLMILAGQPHGFRGKYQDEAFEAMFAFLDKHLGRDSRSRF
jgi:acetyl esterase/lipase